jgi:hypothetical protein
MLILIFYFSEWTQYFKFSLTTSVREGEAKVALCKFLGFLQGVGGDSKTHDYAKNQKLQRLPCVD